MTIYLYIAKLMAKIVYFFLKLLPYQNKVVFVSRFNAHTSLDFKLLIDELKVVAPNIKIVVLNHKLKSKLLLIVDVLTEMYHLATTKYCIIDSYVIPVSILKHRKDLIIIQIWHALGAIKKFGYAAINTKEGAKSNIAKAMDMHQNYSYIIAGGKKTIPNYAEAFNAKTVRIIPYSLPRVDFLVNKNLVAEKQEEIIKKYPMLKTRKNIFYFPTFRKGIKIPYEEVINIVDYNKYNLIIKKHQNDKTSVPYNKNVLYLDEFDVFESLLVADYVISDYSAIFFEAAILDLPMHAFVFDFNKYIFNRGLFMDMHKEFPGIVSIDIKDIYNGIENDFQNKSKYKEFKDNYVEFQDGMCSKRIVDLLEINGGSK